ncbi:MAG TPA: UDP-galactopyranose mutase [Oligoflexus sp.]|uniref:UDP-galactopyranose mutase n=1 Tax=Oligoflexus sp. TaxID=1971216 RepID=UPI002D7E7723|nr:UDP-galactopyranose mutase [Oligoflexus sp.]HET9239359.1 UDP-galactopyranose mutase [Oligoflexus sp.]
MTKKIAIAGAGFAGAVVARELAETGKYKIVVFESRPHLAGNCHTERDAETGVMVHQYGPHIFHTSREDVWKYVNRFAKFGPYTNRVKAVTARGVFSLPINLLTINQFFGKTFDPREAREFIGSLGDSSIEEPKTFEDQALKFLGRDLYENFFYGYTKKQWGVEPTELPASILSRLPVRFNYDDNYYVSRYQGIPIDGYTAIVEKILDHENIEVQLGEKFDPAFKDQFDHVFWSGPIDAYYNFELGRLQYRSLQFERFDAEGDYQGNPVINYCEARIPYTRITEHKHFAPWETHEKTVCFKEYSKLAEPSDTPYYPLRLQKDKELLRQYMDRIQGEPGITFIGRLGTYRYLDMHVVIGESLDLAKTCLGTSISDWPKFSASPL